MRPFSVKHIDHLVLRVKDLDQSVAFYRDVLGCSVVKRRDDLGLIHLRTGTSMIDLVSLSGKLGAQGGSDPGTEGRNVDHLCLRIEPFDAPALERYLQQQGSRPLGPVVTNFGAEGDGPSMYVTDPDGNVIELKGPSTQQEGGA